MTITKPGRIIADRGPRPKLRGWFHFFASIAALVAGTVMATVSAMILPPAGVVGVVIYAVGVVQLFGISAAYHLGPWRSQRTVTWWRRADHATIAIFIAATYTPLSILVFDTKIAAWMLSIAWAGAVAGVILNLVWITHPRWLTVTVYLVLGWLIVPLLPQLWASAGPAVVWLLFAGGVIYSLGAIVYGFKWPGRHATWIGYHEWFHAATIIAAILHMIALWMVIASVGSTVDIMEPLLKCNGG